MNENEYHLGETDELGKRKDQLNEFLERMFDEDEQPFFVSDDACLYDIHAGDDAEFNDRCKRLYGHELSPSDFRIPVWKLLDILYPTTEPPPA